MTHEERVKIVTDIMDSEIDDVCFYADSVERIVNAWENDVAEARQDGIYTGQESVR